MHDDSFDEPDPSSLVGLGTLCNKYACNLCETDGNLKILYQILSGPSLGTIE